MRTSSSAQRALGVAAAVAILAGCSNGGSQVAPSGAMQQNAVRSGLGTKSTGNPFTLITKTGGVIVHPDRSPSRMDPEATTKTLLYISDAGTNDVYVYTYPQGKLTGTLTGFNSPFGECVDKTGNVWITNAGSSQIIEYAHGGTTPIATLEDPGQAPAGCSANVKNGDLAVTNLNPTSGGGAGSVSVYKNAQANPTTYSDASLYRPYFLGYDNKGNLFVDGTNASAVFAYAELPRGKKKFTNITLNVSISSPGGVQWDGNYIAVGDEGGAIYQTSGGTVVGTTTLTGASFVLQFFIEKSKVVVPDVGNKNAGIYKYPTGGSPTTTISGLSAPVGSAVSK